MTVLQGKKENILSADELCAIASRFSKVTVDLGTGDGRNVYRKAKTSPDTLFIGLDPVKDNMAEIASKLIRKPEKGGLSNVLLVLATAEAMPEELKSIADCVTVLFPWGSLLEGIIKPNVKMLEAICGIAKSGAQFEFITTYSDSCEATTIDRRELPELSLEYFNGEYRGTLSKSGFEIVQIELLGNDYVKGFDSKWAKRLAFGRKRDFYRITGTIT